MKSISRFLILIPILALFLSTCTVPLGLGDSIDFEPPVLTLDPGPNPRYIRRDTVLEGSVSDNVAVDRVICEADENNEKMGIKKGDILGTATISGNRWKMSFSFKEKDNGEKISVVIIAFDRIGNSGESSIKPVSLYIDIRPPVFEDVMILRSTTRTASLEPINALKNLYSGDPLGENINNIDRYQNGSFWINARVNEDETKIVANTLFLKIYDANVTGRDVDGKEVYNGVRDVNTSIFAPQWTVTEGELIAAGDRLGWDYTGSINTQGALFFRVTLIAQDFAGNTAIREDFGYFCLNPKADKPKSRLRVHLDKVPPKTDLPVVVYDDDLLEKAYVGLMKRADYLTQLQGLTDEAKINLIKSGTVKDWNNQNITERIGAVTTYPELLDLVLQAGASDTDYGEYVIVSVTKDRKSAPHIANDGNEFLSVWNFNSIDISVTDNNFPIIVIDTVDTTLPPGTGSGQYDQNNHPGHDTIPGALTGNSPEENTFPKLDDTNGRYFTINGYTLRLDKNGDEKGKVNTFKIAWIPDAIINTENIIDTVKTALNDNDNPTLDNYGVQYWDLTNEAYSGTKTSYFMKGTQQQIPPGSGIKYTKQTFKKRFDILGGKDDVKTALNNFHPKDKSHTGDCTDTCGRENKPKVFVLYAKDMDGNPVYKTIRLLGNDAPPSLNVYNLTLDGTINLPSGFNPEQGTSQQTFYANVKTLFNLSTSKPLPSLQPYPRGTTIKIYAIANQDKSGIKIKSIEMHDVTKAPASLATKRGAYGTPPAFDATYIETLPDVTQRVFRFTVTNELGVKNELERTVIASTNAMLNEISTTLPSGLYGLTQNETPANGGTNGVLLRAQFSGSVMVPNDSTVMPKLRIRYQSGSSQQWVYEEITYAGAKNTGGMYMDFYFVIPDGSNPARPYANGLIETIDLSNSASAPASWTYKDYPIYLPDGAKIVDATSGSNVFLPGYNFTNWDSSNAALGSFSLQGTTSPNDRRGREIKLDGLRPIINSFIAGGKAPYTGLVNPSNPGLGNEPANNYYFKDNELIQFTLNASKPIRTSGNGNPRIAFRLRNGDNLNEYLDNTVRYANYLRPAGTNGAMFSIDTSVITIPASVTSQTAQIEITGIDTAQGNIIDAVGNGMTGNITLTGLVRIDKRAPGQVSSTYVNKEGLNAQTPIPYIEGNNSTINKYNENPRLVITPNAGNEPFGALTQYSMDGGLTWETNPNAKSPWTSKDGNELRINNSDGGEWRLVTRQSDKAGNVSSASPVYSLDVNGNFPKLISISAENTSGVYRTGATITINLDFSAPVYTHLTTTDTPNRGYIIIADRFNTAGDGTTENTMRIYAERLISAQASTTLRFIWSNIQGRKQMPNGITITEINLYGVPMIEWDVQDTYGNKGTLSQSAVVGGDVTMYSKTDNTGNAITTEPTYKVSNLRGEGIIIDTIPPELKSTVPANGVQYPTNPAGNSYILTYDAQGRSVIKLTYSENVRKEMGMIAIRPYGDYPIPPVFPAEGYYDDDGIYVQSFFEVYSAAPAANKSTLLAGTFDNPTLSLITGQYAGPYMLTTQGLVEGPGYAAANATGSTNGAGWSVEWGIANTQANKGNVNHFMVPDTRGKYVLDFQYGISDNNATVNNIRNALKAAKYRWREVDVISENVVISCVNKPASTLCASSCTSCGGKTNKGALVTITLDTPLPKGIQWELYYPSGTFTDDPAGNPVPQLGRNAGDTTSGEYWFWTEGVQKPVIRVDRKSMDYRNSTNRINDMNHTTTGTNRTINTAFDDVSFRMECETPGALITYGTLKGGASFDYSGTGTTGNYGVQYTDNDDASTNFLAASALEMYWTGSTGLSEGGWNQRGPVTTGADHDSQNDTPGTWVAANAVRRAQSRRQNPDTNIPDGISGISYSVKDKNGVTSTFTGLGNIWLIRSYNGDARKSDFNALTLKAAPSNLRGYMRLRSANSEIIRASKNYVVAEASKSHPNVTAGTVKGYEGIFLTVVALKNPQSEGKFGNNKVFDPTAGNAGQPLFIFGSDSTNPLPSTAGFPLSLQSSDFRYTRLVTNFQVNANGNGEYWATTEIVTPLYIQWCTMQNGASIGSRAYQSFGEVGRWITGGYGDLTYSYHQDKRTNE